MPLTTTSDEYNALANALRESPPTDLRVLLSLHVVYPEAGYDRRIIDWLHENGRV